MIADTDVLVVGGGIMGCALAYYLAREGVEVAVIDRHDLNTRASGTNAGSLHVQILSHWARVEDPDAIAATQRPLQLYVRSIDVWRELSTELDCDIEFSAQGGFMVAETEDELRLLERKCVRERERGVESRLVSGNELRALAPYFSDAVIGASFCPYEGKVNPILATPALARGAERAGARIFRHTELRALTRNHNAFEAETSRGRVRCRRVVIAAGAWAGEIAAMVGLELPVSRRGLHMNVTEPTAPLVPHLIQHMGQRLTLKQASNGTMIVGGGWPTEADSGWTDPRVLRTSIEGNLWIAARLLPALAELRLMRTWTGIINVMIDGSPVLGPVPGVPGLFIATASVGYTSGPLCARLVAETIRGVEPSMDIAPFSIERFEAGVASAAASTFLEHAPSI